MRNVRRNWKQYTAAAACFALVAVVTANSNMFVDKMNGNDDGVIQEETVVTDSDGNTAVSTTAPAVAAQDNAEENQPTVFEETVENTIPENKTLLPVPGTAAGFLSEAEMHALVLPSGHSQSPRP